MYVIVPTFIYQVTCIENAISQFQRVKNYVLFFFYGKSTYSYALQFYTNPCDTSLRSIDTPFHLHSTYLPTYYAGQPRLCRTVGTSLAKKILFDYEDYFVLGFQSCVITIDFLSLHFIFQPKINRTL